LKKFFLESIAPPVFFGDLLVFKSCAGAQGYILDLVSSTGYRVLGAKKSVSRFMARARLVEVRLRNHADSTQPAFFGEELFFAQVDSSDDFSRPEYAETRQAKRLVTIILP
jgi:hypothetical protein